jgi:hypothetical protein
LLARRLVTVAVNVRTSVHPGCWQTSLAEATPPGAANAQHRAIERAALRHTEFM